MSVMVETGPLTPVVEVSSQEAVEVGRIAARLQLVADGRIDDPGWVAAARAAWDEFPITLRRRVREFRRQSGAQGVLVIRGLPVDEVTLPATPMVAGSVQRSATTAAATLVSIACGLGDPAAFRQEKAGALVQDVVPVPGSEAFQGNAGSVELSFHIENAFHEHRPDYVMLLCLRPDHERVAGLLSSCVRQVLPRLTESSREALSRPEFITQAPPSFGSPAVDTPAHPVLSGAADDPDLRVDFAATRPLHDAGAAALEELCAVLTEVAQSTRTLPGDLAIVDNRVTAHGRTAFVPRYDGADRWLQRTFSLATLRQSRGRRPGDGYVIEG